MQNPNVVVKALDLNSLKSVKTFADDILATEGHIDFLVLNAGMPYWLVFFVFSYSFYLIGTGIMALPNLEHTADGFEKQIGTD